MRTGFGGEKASHLKTRLIWELVNLTGQVTSELPTTTNTKHT